MFNAALSFTDNLPLSLPTDAAGRAGPDPNVTHHHPKWISNTSPVPDSTGCRADPQGYRGAAHCVEATCVYTW